jgi:hypothetical protein
MIKNDRPIRNNPHKLRNHQDNQYGGWIMKLIIDSLLNFPRIFLALICILYLPGDNKGKEKSDLADQELQSEPIPSI